ncbi:MAG: putative DNA binding domain-containing protein, partial [Nanoarchaeota archaeon]|nr:putative DNA binding domain-containing protein [Nanoarchaeota archaeon]
MNKKELLKLIEKGENQEVEFKSKADDGFGKSVCSFANTNDGVVLVGVSDAGKI